MNVVIVDDDKIVSASLKTILETDQEIVISEIGNSGQEACVLYEKHRPDILLMDIRMEGMNGLDAAETILKQDPEAKILFLTTFSDDEYVFKALKIGAKGYILKQDFESILPALKAVYSGQSVLGKEIISKIPDIIQQDKNKQERSVLTGDLLEKEKEIITLVAEGYNNKEIADKMFLGEGTVRNYISNILLKLELRDRTQLAVYYYKKFK